MFQISRMEIVAITSSKSITNESSLIISLFESGVNTLHLRKPKHSRNEIEQILNAVPKKFHNRIIIHKRPELVFKFNLKGIHLTKERREKSFKNWLYRLKFKLRNPKLLFTTTFGSIESLAENTNTFDYIFFGPVFTEKTHYSLSEESGINVLKNAIESSGQKVYAMGGIEQERFELLRKAGFSGVVLPKSIWKEEGEIQEEISPYFAA